MTSIELGFLAVAIVVGGLLLTVGALAGRFYRDRIFAGLTPGLIPAPGQNAPVVKVGPGREYSGEVAVAFSPPKGLRPGQVGTIVDGKAEMRDLTATIVDLAVRGWLRIEAVDTDETRKKARDWIVTPVDSHSGSDRLNTAERILYKSLTSSGNDADGILMSWWVKRDRDSFKEAQQALYRNTVDQGWYAKDPQASGGGCLKVLGVVALAFYCLLMFLVAFSVWTVLSAAILIGAAVFMSRRLTRRVPRTALGTAVMIQALGFKKYLATAEADQFDFEEAAGIFSRYLPYALVFGVAEHWGKVFGEVAQRSHEAGGPDLLDSLMWMDLGMGGLHTMALIADGIGAIADIGDVFNGIGDLADGLGGFVEGVGDFISGIDLDFDF